VRWHGRQRILRNQWGHAMKYRDFHITPERKTTRWQIRDASGAYLVTRPTQQSCAAWVDRYQAYLEHRASDPETATARPAWRGYRGVGRRS
jgi:hypothetical protein